MILLLQPSVLNNSCVMKQTQSIRKISSVTYSNMGMAGPTAPILVGNETYNRRNNPDPSSVHRTTKYPIPSFFEYRSKPDN